MVQTSVYIRTPSSYENKDWVSIGIFAKKQVYFTTSPGSVDPSVSMIRPG
jgi:hypothetical protein